MIPNLSPDIDLASRLFDELRERSFDGVGVTREAFGPGEAMAHDVVRREAEALGLELSTDFALNLYMTLPGADRAAKRVVLGSHLDSVPQGGNFDGAAGVLAGLSAVAGMRRAGFTPGRDITVVALRAEEAGAWFPTSYPGSRAALGRLKPEELGLKRQDNGRTMEDMILEAGGDPGAIRRGARVLGPENTAAYLELHIEQGPVLDADEIPVGIVTGIPGSRRLRHARVVGEYSHWGGGARKYRRGGGVAATELAHRLDEFWGLLDQQGETLVCTFCELATGAQAGFTKIAGEVKFSLDVRSVERARCDAMFAELHRLLRTSGVDRIGPDGAEFPTEFFTESRAEVVAFVPVAAVPSLPGRVEAVQRPAGRFAVVTYDGPMVDLDGAYSAVGRSVTEQALAAEGPIVERYLPRGDEDDLIDHTTEVCWPIRPV